MKDKHTCWVCIAWKPLPSRETISKKLNLPTPINKAGALRLFKNRCPGLRNYTVQPEVK